MPNSIRVLHLTPESGVQVRLQRYLQSNLNTGISPVVLCRGTQQEASGLGMYTPWIPDYGRVLIKYYNPSNLLFYLSKVQAGQVIFDWIGLKKIFKKFDCHVVHAHSPESAYYSYKLGLPTVFDDWEYWLNFFEYCKPVGSNPLGERIKRVFNGAQAYDSSVMRYFMQRHFRKIVEELVRIVPVIVTNSEVEQKYRELGASHIWIVPNVPLSYERNYALVVKKEKKPTITTCYVGNLSADEKMFLRNTSGVRRLWQEENIGDLYIFEGKNYAPHLDVLRKIRECHFNLLFWKPLDGHRYYLQNKAFLASVVGVPTIISSSLKATADLLGEYALRVNSLSEIPEVIKSHDFSKQYSLNPAHLWEKYEPRIKAAYEYTINH